MRNQSVVMLIFQHGPQTVLRQFHIVMANADCMENTVPQPHLAMRPTVWRAPEMRKTVIRRINLAFQLRIRFLQRHLFQRSRRPICRKSFVIGNIFRKQTIDIRMDQHRIEMLAETDQQSSVFRQRRICIRQIINCRISFYQNMIGINQNTLRLFCFKSIRKQ